MSAIEVPNNKWLRIGLVILLVVLVLIASASFMYYVLALAALAIVVNLLRVLAVVVFVVLGWRDLVLLVTRPKEAARTMGRGVNRVWSMARTTMFEAWAGRIWMLPVLWLIAAAILIGSVRPFDETERIPLYIRMLLSSQEILLLVMLWVMACISLPRERERKIVMTNASKPLSRLEIVLGKMVGFWTAAGALLIVMGLASLVILYVSDYRLKSRAAAAYELQRQDFAKTFKAPSESLHRLSDEGSLFAYNNIFVPRNGMSIGAMAFSADGTSARRFLVGGTYETATYRFYPHLVVPAEELLQPPGDRPFFFFQFPNDSNGPVKIHVTAQRSDPHATPPPRPQDKDLELRPDGTATWEPDDPAELFTAVYPNVTDERGEVSVSVSCRTPGALLEIMEGADPDPKTGQIPADAQFNVYFGDRQTNGPAAAPRAHPVLRGFERRERQEIAGPKADGTKNPSLPELAIYRFPGSSLRHVPIDSQNNFTLALNLETYKGENAQRTTMARILVKSFDNGAVPPFTIEREVLEKRVMTVQIPAAQLGDPVGSKRGDMLVAVECLTPGHSLSVVENSVSINLPPTPFFVNLLKSEAVIFLEAALLIGISVACSVRLGWAVAMFCSAVCLGFGYFVDFIVGLQEYGGLSALNYLDLGKKSLTYEFFDNVTGVLWKFLGILAQIVPNFTIYRAQDFIGSLQNMPWHVLGTDLLDTLFFLAPVIAIAYLLIRKQELG